MKEHCFAPLKEKAGELPKYLRELIQQNPPWQEHFGFDCVQIGINWVLQEPALLSLHDVCPIGRIGLLRIPASTMYDWHTDTYRLSCVNMLISENHHSHTLFGNQANKMNKTICELKYEPSTYYLFNNQQEHCVVNLDEDRYLLSLYFANETFYEELLGLAKAQNLVAD